MMRPLDCWQTYWHLHSVQNLRKMAFQPRRWMSRDSISVNNLMSHCGLDPQSSGEEMPYQVRHDSLYLNPLSHCGLDLQSSGEEMPYQVRHDRYI